MREMNLLPEEYLYKLEQKRKRRFYIISISLLVLILVGTYLALYFKDYTMRKEIISVKSKIEDLEKIKDIQLEISASQEILDSRMAALEIVESKRVDLLEFLNNLEDALPKDIALETLSHPNGKNFFLKASTTKPEQIAEFMVNLAKINNLKNVTLENSLYGSEEGNKDLTVFNIYFTYSNEGGGESDDLNQ